MATSFEKLQTLLSELFQLDQADLDFGIYRIMNQKRDEITRFLNKELLPQVKTAFAQYHPADKKLLEEKLEEARQAAQTLGVNPEETSKVKDILAQIAAFSVDTEALENEVYSHLYSFFRRYYYEGDFISMRRYKEGVYAIPYEGEEVKLHWANADQYYIKTAEYFRDYTFKLPSGKLAHFKIAEADVEKDNVKAAEEKDRRFILAGENAVRVENDEIIIRFEYRVDADKRKQDAINSQTIADVLAAPAAAEWVADLNGLAPIESNPRRTVLEKHLTDYTARNTFDYFIHKNLRGFLRRELDFYIKNEVMRLDDIENENAPRVEQYLSKVKALRSIAHKIIEFLAQIEDFQKKLWLKKKFVVETNYCITLDRVPEELYPEIAANDTQREEWVRLFAIDEIKGDLVTPAYSIPVTVEFIKANQYLVLDTKFFNTLFVNKLLSNFDDIESQTNGLLVHSENFQGLNLLHQRFNKQVACVHIDPPYNTDTSGFLYKNNYQHGSWLALMDDRIKAAIPYLKDDGSFLCHIDENEYELLYLVFANYGFNYLGNVVWDKRNPMMGGKGIAIQHEHIIWASNHTGQFEARNENILMIIEKAEAVITAYGGVNSQSREEFSEWVKQVDGLTGGERMYNLINDDGKVYRLVSMSWPNPNPAPEQFFVPLVHPVTKKTCPVPARGWSRTPEKMKELIDKNEIVFGVDETTIPQRKIFLSKDTRRPISSIIANGKKGKTEVDNMGLEFSYCHPVSLYEEIINSTAFNKDDYILDYFAGSGTAGHATINLNREDDGSRKYILIEMGDHFNNVTKPRIQKSIYSKDWRNGKPISRVGASQFFKYIRLETYDETLSNIQLRRNQAQQMALGQSTTFKENYMLSYMLDSESQQTLLNIETFAHPFIYQLNIANGKVGESKPTNIDLVETFNYLIGLQVKTMQTVRGYKVVTGLTPAGERALIIWRDLTEKSNADLEEFFRKQDYNPRDMEFDLIYVNGDNNLENLRRPDETWKVRLIEDEFMRLMFDTEGL